MGGEAVRYASPLLNLHIASGPLSARVIAGGEGGARAKRGRVRWAPTLAPQTSRAYQTPPHLPIASQWVPSSPPLRGGEDPRKLCPTGAEGSHGHLSLLMTPPSAYEADTSPTSLGRTLRSTLQLLAGACLEEDDPTALVRRTRGTVVGGSGCAGSADIHHLVGRPGFHAAIAGLGRGGNGR
jgi:hypothetical protein